MAEIRENRVKQKLADGDIAIAAMGPMSTDIVDFLGQFDFDGIWLEAEHGPADYSRVPDLTRACDLWGKTSILRVNYNHPGLIYRALDNGAMGVAIPHVKTADEARAVAEAAKFGPVGLRGSYGGRQSYGVDDYFGKANDQTMTVILIESVEGIQNLPEILKVDHIDVFFIARGDLSQSMGYPGEADHPEVLKVTDDAMAMAIEAGRVTGTSVSNNDIERWVEVGARFGTVSWPPWLTAGARGFLDKVSALS